MSIVATDQVLKELCRETGEPGFHNYTTLQGYMLDCIRELNIYSLPTWSKKQLNITAVNTFDWPCDCVKPLMTVLKRGNQRFLLSVSDDIVGTVGPTPAELAQTPPTECEVEDLYALDGFIESFGWSFWNWGLGEIYGANTLLPPFGLVVHNPKGRNSFIKGCNLKTGDQIILIFKSDGLADCPEFIPSETKECSEFFILMKYYRRRDPNFSERMDVKYKERLYRLERFDSDEDLDQWTRAFYSSDHSAPKD